MHAYISVFILVFGLTQNIAQVNIIKLLSWKKYDIKIFSLLFMACNHFMLFSANLRGRNG